MRGEPITIHPDNWIALRRFLDTPQRKGRKPTPKDLVYRMAEANYDLPDGHPNKITPEDVADLQAVLLMADVRSGSAANVLHRATAAIAKLAALLPPEPADDA